ncbi:hypothetical protein KEM55_002376 [Ascosphaera atra]|nr:hypothetical protein KEM55_002376 [Ascosphaera atra]
MWPLKTQPVWALVLACWSVLISSSFALFSDEAYEIDYHHGLIGKPLLASGASPASEDLFLLAKPTWDSRASLIYTLSEKLVLGAVKPKDGAAVWRQELGHFVAQGEDNKAFLKAADRGDTIVTGVGRTVSSWAAMNGRFGWSKTLDGTLVDVEVIEGSAGDIATLSQTGSDSEVQLLHHDRGMALWTFKDTSNNVPVKLAATSTSVFYVSLQGWTTSKLHVSELDVATGSLKSEYTLSGDVPSLESVIYVGDNTALPIIAWTDKSLKTLKINLLGSDAVQTLAIDNKSGENIEKVRVRAHGRPSANPHFLVEYTTATSSWAQIYHVDISKLDVTKAHSLPLLQEKSIFAASTVNKDVYFTRIGDSGMKLYSATQDGPLGEWPVSKALSGAPVVQIFEAVPMGSSKWSVRSSQVHENGDISLVLNDDTKWTRPESLAETVAVGWASIQPGEALAHELEVEGVQSVLQAYVHRVKRHLKALQGLPDQIRGLPSRVVSGFLPSDGAELNWFDVGKKMILATSKGRVACLDSGRHGAVAWNIQAVDLPEGKKWDVKAVRCNHGIATIYPADGGYVKVDVEKGTVIEVDKSAQDTSSIVFLDEVTPVRVNRDGVPDFSTVPSTAKDTQHYIVTRDDKGNVVGWSTANPNEEAWRFAPPAGEHIVDVVARPAHDPVASIGKVLGNRSVLYKYLNPNLVLVTATGGPKASFYLLNGVSGEVLHTATHYGVDTTKPISSTISENWFAYSLFSDVSVHSEGKGYQLVINELYESPLPNERGKLGEAVNYTNINSPSPHVISQAYVVAEPISSMSATQTRQGITMRNLLVYLPESGSIASIPRLLLNPRRPVGHAPTPAEAEEGLTQYAPNLEIDGRWYLSHAREVRGIKHVLTNPTVLESTGLVFAFGSLDLFGTRVHPSMAFDVLGKGFNKVQLVLTVIGLAVGVAALRPMANRKQVNLMWKA